MTSVLPSNATPLELAAEAAFAAAIDLDVSIETLANPDACPEHLLAWLAWAYSVDVWDPAWPVGVKRQVVRDSIEVHRRKGTVGSVKRALAAAGYPGATIVEGFGRRLRDGSLLRDGTNLRQPGDHWAEYRVFVPRAMTIAQAAQARKIIEASAPARCRLTLFDFTEATHLRDGSQLRNGTITRGQIQQ